MEQDDIDFDEEELEGERVRPKQTEETEDEDVQMAGPESETLMDGSSSSIRPEHLTSDGDDEPSAMEGQQADEAPPPAQPEAAKPKRKIRITHDQYMELQSLIVIHLTEVERVTANGLDREELIDWYLEQKEDLMQDIEDIEYQKELVTKMLRKLVKVCSYERL